MSTPRKIGRRPKNEGVSMRLAEACAGMPYIELARVTGVPPDCVRRYVTGLTPPTVEFVIKVSVAFGFSLDWVLLGSGPMLRLGVEQQVLRNAGLEQLLLAIAAEVRELVRTLPRGAVVPVAEDFPSAGGGTGVRAGVGGQAASMIEGRPSVAGAVTAPGVGETKRRRRRK